MKITINGKELDINTKITEKNKNELENVLRELQNKKVEIVYDAENRQLQFIYEGKATGVDINTGADKDGKYPFDKAIVEVCKKAGIDLNKAGNKGSRKKSILALFGFGVAAALAATARSMLGSQESSGVDLVPGTTPTASRFDPDNIGSTKHPFVLPSWDAHLEKQGLNAGDIEYLAEQTASFNIDLDNPSADGFRRMLQAVCQINLDVVLDASGSQTGAFADTKKFVKDIVSGSNISPTGSTGAVSKYSIYAQTSGAPTTDLQTLLSYIDNMKFQGGGTYMRTALEVIKQQLIDKQVVPTAAKPLVIPLITDFIDDSSADVKALIKDITAAAGGSQNMRMVCIGVDGGDGVNTQLLNEICPDEKFQFVFYNPNAIGQAINKVTDIMQSICGVSTTAAPITSAPTTGAPTTGAPTTSAPTTSAPTKSPTPAANTTAPTSSPTTPGAPPLTGGEICGIVCWLPLLLLLPGVRYKTEKTEEETPATPGADVEAGTAAPVQHTVTRDPATYMTAKSATHQERDVMGEHSTWGIPLTSLGINTYRDVGASSVPLPGAGESREREQSSSAATPEPATDSKVKDKVVPVSLLVVTLVKLFSEEVLKREREKLGSERLEIDAYKPFMKALDAIKGALGKKAAAESVSDSETTRRDSPPEQPSVGGGSAVFARELQNARGLTPFRSDGPGSS